LAQAGFVRIKKNAADCHSERVARRIPRIFPVARRRGILHPLKRVQNDKGTCFIACKKTAPLPKSPTPGVAFSPLL
jgi:hypothetical protein